MFKCDVLCDSNDLSSWGAGLAPDEAADPTDQTDLVFYDKRLFFLSMPFSILLKMMFSEIKYYKFGTITYAGYIMLNIRKFSCNEWVVYCISTNYFREIK
jgi:hypothetical protein